MEKFHYHFSLSSATDTARIYESEGNTVRLDFISGSCLRVAVYRNKNTMLPTFSVNPDGEFLTAGRTRLSTEGFSMYLSLIHI